ncbi:PREDICTED: uncharacterized protein LOC104808538 [Tarenaya hassleriana]|uniref:uncharacterized protein LOC104808538 n=1 Tax=Tarenaya hassleriana TaxID=28532 RepID=UPI00053C49BC|nr:PREDICTED: uncharacterized protein LOC104808538 [Tarenaya hassleriana]
MGKKDHEDQKVESVLHLLCKQSPLSLKQEKFCDKDCVERFLKGKGDNVKKAAKQLRSCLSWRQSIGIESLAAEEFSAELADGVAYVAGHDGEFRPVIIFRFKQDYLKLHSQKQFTRFVAFTLETAIATMTRNMGQFVLLFDASFFRSAPTFTNLLLATLKILVENYPCRLYKAFIIDPPSLFSYIWKGFRPFVELSTVTVVVSSLDYEESLDFSHVSTFPRSASLRFHPSSIKSTARIGSSSSRFAFTVSHHRDSLKPWYLSFTDTSPLPVTSSAAGKISPMSARSLSFASPAYRGLDVPPPAACRKSLFPSTPLPEKSTTEFRPRTPRPSFFQSPATFFRRESHVSGGGGGGGGEKARESFVPYLKFYRRPYDEFGYRSKLRGPRRFLSVVSPQIRRRHVSVSQRF